MVPVKLLGMGKEIAVDGLIDSSLSRNLFSLLTNNASCVAKLFRFTLAAIKPKSTFTGLWDTPHRLGRKLLCLQKAELAQELGIPLERSAPALVKTVSEKVAVHLHKIRLQVLGEPFECEAAFIKNMGTSFNLLGRVGFFERHGITFKENEKKVVLNENA